jgi:hypothetical protein
MVIKRVEAIVLGADLGINSGEDGLALGLRGSLGFLQGLAMRAPANGLLLAERALEPVGPIALFRSVFPVEGNGSRVSAKQALELSRDRFVLRALGGEVRLGSGSHARR